MNMCSANGFSASTEYTLTPPPAPAQLKKLAGGGDQNWIGWKYPWHPLSPLKAATHFRFFFPIEGAPHPSITDIWLTPIGASETFTTNMLGSVADTWHRMVENYRTDAEWSTKNLVTRAMRAGQESSTATDRGHKAVPYGYPTLSMSLDIKKHLPAPGVKWLFIRAQAKEIKNGRMDAEVTILDEFHELVALSHQVSFIVDTTTGGENRQKSENCRL